MTAGGPVQKSRLVVVFIKFDNGGPSDKFYDEVIAPACRKAGLIPYRVDRDLEAVVPIETLKTKIRESAVCIADLTSNSQNVAYELGIADTLQKDVILILNGKKVWFDISHRSVVFYKTQAPSDFCSFENNLVERLRAITPVLEQVGSPNGHDLKVLMALLCSPKGLTEFDISQFLGESGIQTAKTILSVHELERLEHIVGSVVQDFDGDPLRAYKLTEKGMEWLRNNRGE